MKLSIMLVLPCSLGLAGCGLLDLITVNVTTVRMINNSDYPVDVIIFYDEEDDIPEDLLTEIGSEATFTIPAGGVQSFARDCDALRAVLVEGDLRLPLGDLGPKTDTGVLREDDQYACNDIITVTFDHSAVILDFDATVQTSRR